MYTASIFFHGQYRPAYWQAATLADAVEAARLATRNMPDSDGIKLRQWIDESALSINRNPSIESASSSHGMIGFSVVKRPHDPFLNSVTASMPHAPGLDYSDCCNLSDAEIDDGIDGEADRSRA